MPEPDSIEEVQRTVREFHSPDYSGEWGKELFYNDPRQLMEGFFKSPYYREGCDLHSEHLPGFDEWAEAVRGRVEQKGEKVTEQELREMFDEDPKTKLLLLRWVQDKVQFDFDRKFWEKDPTLSALLPYYDAYRGTVLPKPNEKLTAEAIKDRDTQRSAAHTVLAGKLREYDIVPTSNLGRGLASILLEADLGSEVSSATLRSAIDNELSFRLAIQGGRRR